MSTTIEWVRAPGLWGRLILPSDFTDDEGQFRDEEIDPSDPDQDPTENYGVIFDSGGHYTLVYGEVSDLEEAARQLTALAEKARDYRTATRLAAELGTCDTCDGPYPLTPKMPQYCCGDCGKCGLHCPHVPKGDGTDG